MRCSNDAEIDLDDDEENEYDAAKGGLSGKANLYAICHENQVLFFMRFFTFFKVRIIANCFFNVF